MKMTPYELLGIDYLAPNSQGLSLFGQAWKTLCDDCSQKESITSLRRIAIAVDHQLAHCGLPNARVPASDFLPDSSWSSVDKIDPLTARLILDRVENPSSFPPQWLNAAKKVDEARLFKLRYSLE